MKRNYRKILVLALIIVGISGCSSKTAETIDTSQQHLIWHDEREKAFGMFDYPKISEREAIDLLTNKFQVKLPAFLEQTKQMFQEEILTSSIQEAEPEYSIFARGDQLQIRGFYPFNHQNELAVFAYIDLVYKFDKENKQVKLTTQSLSMSNYGSDALYPNDNFYELVQRAGKLIGLPKVEQDRAIDNFKNDYEEIEQRPTNEKIVLFSNDDEANEKKKLSQAMRIGFNEHREMREIYAVLVDYSE
ncbi:hypothetical protein DOK67_0002327 [Enterococcus sp. DIV0212c]|uniref:hypothetical protein n=1 Tax=Enterococcus sp. DIV0212c TaxID=2230867 RepID=UPI001A9AEE19|nr:hypothetical protein [Enterococcus sp. DIV0212c]MBO1355267.1 hypothetical protein [Enterococcus sp. DIV0212c]